MPKTAKSKKASRPTALKETVAMAMTAKSKKASRPRRPRKSPAQKRKELRDRYWRDSSGQVWCRLTNDGFVTIPRLLPLVMVLINMLAKKGNPSLVYFELWARSFDEGIATVDHESDCAYASGYTGTRAERTWREHVLQLQELGFIKTAARGNRETACVLLLNPLEVCARLHADKRVHVPDEWWNAFVDRASQIGADLPEL